MIIVCSARRRCENHAISRVLIRATGEIQRRSSAAPHRRTLCARLHVQCRSLTVLPFRYVMIISDAVASRFLVYIGAGSAVAGCVAWNRRTFSFRKTSTRFATVDCRVDIRKHRNKKYVFTPY